MVGWKGAHSRSLPAQSTHPSRDHHRGMVVHRFRCWFRYWSLPSSSVFFLLVTSEWIISLLDDADILADGVDERAPPPGLRLVSSGAGADDACGDDDAIDVGDLPCGLYAKAVTSFFWNIDSFSTEAQIFETSSACSFPGLAFRAAPSDARSRVGREAARRASRREVRDDGRAKRGGEGAESGRARHSSRRSRRRCGPESARRRRTIGRSSDQKIRRSELDSSVARSPAGRRSQSRPRGKMIHCHACPPDPAAFLSFQDSSRTRAHSTADLPSPRRSLAR